VYTVYNTLQLEPSYSGFPETSALSLEEIDRGFEMPGARLVKMLFDMKKAQK
jgi:hypothetical protein